MKSCCRNVSLIFLKSYWTILNYNENDEYFQCQNALFLSISSSLLPGIDQTNQVGSNDDQGRV